MSIKSVTARIDEHYDLPKLSAGGDSAEQVVDVDWPVARHPMINKVHFFLKLRHTITLVCVAFKYESPKSTIQRWSIKGIGNVGDALGWSGVCVRLCNCVSVRPSHVSRLCKL